jgi:hypothetical protein
MAIQSGGPHILLFERDQQLTALLMSEFQLAGYECHAARTAVEVFDAIARFPIRLVLVNLAQAAAGRREFWVALDAQRRGRGVQVFTFRCMNIAGYGVDDPDERVRIVLTDMEVDGMLGVMNLVDAVRARIPASSTGSISRVNAPTQVRDSARLEAIRPVSQPGFSAAPVPPPSPTAAQVTAPLSAMSAPPPAPMPVAPPAPSVAPIPPAASASPVSQPPAPQRQATSAGVTEQPHPPRPGAQPSTFTDKIRAVIRPGNRGIGLNPEANWMPYSSTQRPDVADSASQSASTGTAPAQPGQDMPPVGERTAFPMQQGEESGLAQLSRMAQPATGDVLLRASPIEDLPLERLPDRRNGTTGQAGTIGSAPAQAFTPPMPPIETKQPVRVQGAPAQSLKTQQEAQIDAIFVEQGTRGSQGGQGRQDEQAAPGSGEAPEIAAAPGVPGMSELLTAAALRRRSEHNVTSEDILLDIVQSLPPINTLPTPAAPLPPPQASVLSGRATRSLAHVLLDGHLVPQDRLEVAQHIQRMLRGVDLNYQLGEILLMFKLLTPDQLLAASLVSYGMISAMQVSALGRIRQELHALGLEYDLESLLVLFRMLTPEQMREVRASWTG